MRLKTTVTAAALSVALAGSTFAVPEASAQAQGGPITLSSLQIGADAAAVHFQPQIRDMLANIRF